MQHLQTASGGAHHQTERTRRLAFTVPGMDHQQPRVFS
jgi:hypothetical protein